MASTDDIDRLIEQTLTQIRGLKLKILRKNQTKDQTKLEGYKVTAFQIYNKFAEFNSQYFDNLDDPSKRKLRAAFVEIRDYMVKYTAALKLDVDIPIDSKTIINTANIKQFDSSAETEDDEPNESIHSEESDYDNAVDNAMDNAKSERHFLQLCASTINKDFDGDPNHLQSFIDKIDLLLKFAKTSDLKGILLSFAIAKLNKTTRSKITIKPRSIDSLIDALKIAVKHESSDVLEGRLLSLRSKTMEEFAQKAEKLADSFRQALILEEVGPAKANEMAIAKTVQLCRSRTNAPDVKAVLRSTPFKTVEHVISTLITCTHEVQKEREHEFYVKNSKSKNYRPKGQQNDKSKNFDRKSDNKPPGGQQNPKNDYRQGKQKFGKPKNANQGQFPNGQVYHMAGNEWGTPQGPQGEYSYQPSNSAQQPRQNQSQNHRTTQ